MKILKSCIVVAMAAFMAIAAYAQDNRHYVIDVHDFTSLKVKDGINVIYRCSADSAGMAVFDAPAELASAIMLSNPKETLTVELAPSDRQLKAIPTLTVYSRFLTEVENSGDSLVKVASMSPTASFKAVLVGNGRIAVHGLDVNSVQASLRTGNGSLLLNGRANQAKYSLTGTGSIQAADVQASTVRCSILGTGYIECHPLTRLNVSSTVGVSSGKVYYLGNPEIRNNSLGIKILPIE